MVSNGVDWCWNGIHIAQALVLEKVSAYIAKRVRRAREMIRRAE
jgi:hypothetical protein